MKNLRSWAILAAVVGAVGLTAYAAAESASISTANGVTENATGTTEVNTGCQPYPATNRGTVKVNYVNTKGEVIKTFMTITQDVGTNYDASTAEFKPATIEYKGVNYAIDEASTKGTPTGNITEATQEVTYVYSDTGSIVLRYFYNGTLKKEQTLVNEVLVGTPYNYDGQYLPLSSNTGYYAIGRTIHDLSLHDGTSVKSLLTQEELDTIIKGTGEQIMGGIWFVADPVTNYEYSGTIKAGTIYFDFNILYQISGIVAD